MLRCSDAKERIAPLNAVKAFAVLSLLLFSALPTTAQNLVVNGDFTSALTGFTSQYTQGNIGGPGRYVIGTNPNTAAGWASYGDHTTGSGNMMIVNGSQTTGLNFWQQSIAVNTNTNYVFSVWVANATFAPLANISLLVNNVSVATVSTPQATGTWLRGSGAWSSSTNTVANLSLTNLQTAFGGNDFTVDDISFVAGPTVVPEPGTFALIGLVGVPFVARFARRRK